jgi:hypothetical protein
MRNAREGSVRTDLLQDVAIDIDNEIPLLARKIYWIHIGREYFPSACSRKEMGQDHLGEITWPSTGDIDGGTGSELTDNAIFS